MMRRRNVLDFLECEREREREREERTADSASINYAGRFPSRFLFIHRDSGEEKRRRTPVRLALRARERVRASLAEASVG